MSTTLAGRVPISTPDPYTDQALLNPWPLYRELREMGPIVWLEKYGMFALTRYDVVATIQRTGIAQDVGGKHPVFASGTAKTRPSNP